MGKGKPTRFPPPPLPGSRSNAGGERGEATGQRTGRQVGNWPRPSRLTPRRAEGAQRGPRCSNLATFLLSARPGPPDDGVKGRRSTYLGDGQLEISLPAPPLSLSKPGQAASLFQGEQPGERQPDLRGGVPQTARGYYRKTEASSSRRPTSLATLPLAEPEGQSPASFLEVQATSSPRNSLAKPRRQASFGRAS